MWKRLNFIRTIDIRRLNFLSKNKDLINEQLSKSHQGLPQILSLSHLSRALPI